MTRQRSTWTDESGRTAAQTRRADIYTMNQEHPQPSAVEYENGSPDSWAETPTENQSVEKEYENGRVKRNEMNFGEFREDTWKHKDSDAWNDGKGKYDNMRSAAERKAMAAERIARSTLRGASEVAIEEQASELMALPDRFLVASLRRLDQLDPDLLPPKTRYNRAVACARLAARTLGPDASEKQVEKMGSVYMGLDDSTLKSLIQVASEVRVAEEKEEDEEGDKKPETTASTAPTATVEPTAAGAGADAHCEPGALAPADLATLDKLLADAAGGVAPAAPAAPPADDLTVMFTEPAPAAPAAPAAMPMAASAKTANDIDISFDGDDEEVDISTKTASDTTLGIDDIFSDLPDVQAQREARAASEEQQRREMGYGPATAPGGRTASTQPAKKLGAVRAARPGTEDDALNSIWERPGPRA